jgi:hypothetical protein
MPRRQQTEYRPPTAEIQPVATPNSRPFVPKLGPETILPVKEFAALSQTLHKITVQQAERDAERDVVEGFMEDQGAPDPVAAVAQATKDQDAADAAQVANQEAFAKAEQKGTIEGYQNPWKKVGATQSQAHRLMSGYDQKLNAAMAAATQTTDENGDPVVPKDPQAVIAEVWAQYKDNPVLQNYYGAKVAKQMKLDADARFVETAAKTLDANQTRETVTWATNSLSQKMLGMSVAGQEPTAETWEEVRAWSKDLYLKTGGKAKTREIMLDAVKGAASQQDAADDGASGVSRAAELIRDFLGAPVGGTTLGKDAIAAPELESMIAHYEDQQKTKAENAARKEAAEDARAVNQAEREAFAALDKARERGPLDVVAEVEKYMASAREDNRFGERTGLVADAMQKLALTSEEKEGALASSKIIEDLDAGLISPDEAMYQARALQQSLGIEGYRKVQQAAKDRTDLRPLIEDSPIAQRWGKNIGDAAEVPGIPQAMRGEIGVEVQALNRSDVAAFQSRQAAAMKAIAALPPEQRDEAQRKWYDENGAELVKTLNERGQKWNDDRAAARVQIVDAIKHSQPIDALLQQHADKFGSEELEPFRAAADHAADYEALTSLPSYQRGVATIVGEVQAQYKDDEDLGVLTAATEDVAHDLFVNSIGEKLAGADPAKKNAVIAATVREVRDQVLEEVKGIKLKRFTEAAQPGGETVPEAKELIEFGEASRKRAADAIKTTDKDQLAEMLVATNPDVPSSVAGYQASFLKATVLPTSERFSTQMPMFGLFQMVEKQDVENQVEFEGKNVLNDPKLSPKAKAQAVADMYKVTGIPAQDLLDNKIVLRPSAAWRKKAESHLARLSGSSNANSQRLAGLLRDELAKPPPEVSADGVKVDIYNTPIAATEAELSLLLNTRKPEVEKLVRKYGVLDGATAFDEWVIFQQAAVKRLNQEN